MKKRHYILLAILSLFIILQFIKPDRNTSGQVSSENLMDYYHAPNSVRQILQKSCMDCHSNNTQYPWYANVQPIGWLIDSHIKKGKEELNFDEFHSYSDRRKISKLKSMRSQIDEDNMPLVSYTLIHRNAILSEQQKTLLDNWFGQIIDTLKSEKTQ